MAERDIVCVAVPVEAVGPASPVSVTLMLKADVVDCDPDVVDFAAGAGGACCVTVMEWTIGGLFCGRYAALTLSRCAAVVVRLARNWRKRAFGLVIGEPDASVMAGAQSLQELSGRRRLPERVSILTPSPSHRKRPQREVALASKTGDS